MASIKSVLGRLSPRGKIALGGAALAILILVFVLFQMATKQSYTTLATGIEPSETGQVTEVLSEKGIPYKLENSGTAVGLTASSEKSCSSGKVIVTLEPFTPSTWSMVRSSSPSSARW